ncbi:MAG: hydrogen gas-evolving membrane-bound hydrogenase subunit E [Thermomicrobiales bacterium]
MVETFAAPSPLLLLAVALLSAPLTLLLGWGRPRLAAVLAVALAGSCYLLTLSSWLGGGGAVEFSWVPSWDLRVRLAFDGVSAIYGLLATGVGTVVLVYSSVYLPRHLHHHHRDPGEATVFYSLILLFMSAMLGLVMADDLLLLFIFWDLTAITSYFLIGFDRDEPASRPAALMALLVTGGTAILMLVGVMMLWAQTGTMSVSELVAQAEGTDAFTIAIWLIAIAALAKSAQMPLHFWLPRAMVAPTPVSSYLHSAAMVAAGVFLLERLLPLVHRAAWLPQALLVTGLCSIMIGGVLALGRDDMKRVLAYSTIGQYGYVVVMLGLGGVYGAVGAAMYVLAHAAAKCALFLTAGAVTEATGKKNLSEVGGLQRPMPLLAVTSGIAAAAIAALPGTMGFFKDELFFAAMHEAGTGFTVLAVAAAALTFAYIARFWGSIFLGELRTSPGKLPWLMPAAVLALAAVCVVFGVWVGPANELANAGGSASLFERVSVGLAYHLDTRPENLMALSAWVGGAAILLTLRLWQVVSRFVSDIGARFGPERFYRRSLESVNAISDRMHGYEVHDLRSRVATVLLPVGVFVLLGLIFTPNEGMFLAGSLAASDLEIILLLAVACLAAVTTTQVQGHLTAVLLVSAVGFPLAAVYAFLGAPDVALVAVLMETVLSLLFIGFLAAMRDRPRVSGFETTREGLHRNRDRFIGVLAGVASFVVVWGIFSKPAAIESVATQQIELTPAAHASDVVTAILSDFRGLDTMGEITVIGITMIGLITLLQRPMQRRGRE